jgi:hypothetical protein
MKAFCNIQPARKGRFGGTGLTARALGRILRNLAVLPQPGRQAIKNGTSADVLDLPCAGISDSQSEAKEKAPAGAVKPWCKPSNRK